MSYTATDIMCLHAVMLVWNINTVCTCVNMYMHDVYYAIKGICEAEQKQWCYGAAFSNCHIFTFLYTGLFAV